MVLQPVQVHEDVKVGGIGVKDQNAWNSSPNALADGGEFTKGRIIKNLIVVSLAVMLYLTSSLPCRELQGSINMQQGLGAMSQSVFSGSSVISQLFLPSFVIYYLGLKNCIIMSLLLETVFYFANFYPVFATMIPAALISGFGGAPIWTAKATYLTLLAEKWARASNLKMETTLSILFGCFYGFYYAGYAFGNVASYFILAPDDGRPSIVNSTVKCGLGFCDYEAENTNSNFLRPPIFEIYTLFGAFIVCSWAGALLVALFLDPIPREEQKVNSSTGLILLTVKALGNPQQWLLIPISMFRGIMRTFVASEFTKAYVTCSLAVHYVGLTMIAFGILCGASSFIFGHLARFTGRIPLFCFSTVILVVLAISLSEWRPSEATFSLFFIIPALFGVSNSVWESQVANIYGIMFPGQRDISYSLYSFAEGVGSTIAQSYSYSLCLNIKLTILVVSLAVAFFSYLITEFKVIRKLMISFNGEENSF